MVRIRLTRTGSKKQPTYRIVVMEITQPRDGKFIEVLGTYNPRTRPSTEIIKEDRALYWLSVGASPTEAVAGILRRNGTMERFERYSQNRTPEMMAALVAEGAAAPRELPSQRTNYPAPSSGQSYIKAAKAAQK